jgi:cell division protein FtsI (penicillin-binding protein 3)
LIETGTPAKTERVLRSLDDMKQNWIHTDFSRTRHSIARSPGTMKTRKIRLGIVASVAVLWTGLLVSRLYSLQVSDFGRWREWALKQHSTEIELASERGAIHDREGKLLAVSVPAGSVYVRPRSVKDKESTAQKIAEILKLPRKDVLRSIQQNKPFVWIQRQVPRPVAQQVADLSLPGVGFMLESRRFYPYNHSASTLIGRVGIDGHGLSGLEAVYERHLRGPDQTVRLSRDALGNMIELVGEQPIETELPKGQALKLTIDAGLQIIMDEELEAGRKSANAKSAMAALIDAGTGEVLAMSQAPAFNFNVPTIASKDQLTNKIVETVFEPGSILKPIVAAAAFDSGVVKPNDLINCENGRYRFGSHTIKDVHPSATISFGDVLIRSSNIGMAKIGARMGREKLYDSLRLFGFGQLTGLGLPGESGGILRSPQNWAVVDIATHSFGQGIAVTPLQMLRAMAAVANGGNLPQLRVVDKGEPATLQRILSPRAATQVRELLYGVVEDEHGTGAKAAVEGVRIGGKTGTAQKANPNGRGYLPGAYIASFVGFADGHEIGAPKTLALIVTIDEPNTTSIYGGTLAAPVFKRVMQRSLHFLSTREQLHGNDGEQNGAGVVVSDLPKNSSSFTPVRYQSQP